MVLQHMGCMPQFYSIMSRGNSIVRITHLSSELKSNNRVDRKDMASTMGKIGHSFE
jgi:hypothetical protein